METVSGHTASAIILGQSVIELDDPCGDANDNGVGRDGMGNDGVCADDRAVADVDVAEQDAASPEEDAVSDSRDAITGSDPPPAKRSRWSRAGRSGSLGPRRRRSG